MAVCGEAKPAMSRKSGLHDALAPRGAARSSTDMIAAMASNPFLTALIAITSILSGIALIAWIVSLNYGSGFAAAISILALTLPGAFLSLLATLLSGALLWKPGPSARPVETTKHPSDRHWLDQSPREVENEVKPSEPDSW